ncbi:inverse autotransporter beta domain-containing protein [Escherichia coli]
MKHARANGWDVRAEGWLPAWLHLGGKLVMNSIRAMK